MDVFSTFLYTTSITNFLGGKQSNFIKPAELIKSAVENGIPAGSNAYHALLSINTKYANSLTSSDKSGTTVYMFEGVGNDSSASARMNAMGVVVKNGDIVYPNRNCSTIPDYPFTPSKNHWTPMPTLKSGKLIVDRTYAYDYLVAVGYPADAIRAIG